MNNELIETTPELEEMEITAPELLNGCNALRLCDPEDVFDIIEQCKICGRCI